MKITARGIRRFVYNVRRIEQNYNVLKYWAKEGRGIDMPIRRWGYKLNAKKPTLSNVCFHLIDAYYGCANPESYYYKYEMIPSKIHIREFQLFKHILTKEFIFDSSDGEKEITLDDISRLYYKYNADKLYYNYGVFDADFCTYYERYSNESYDVELVDRKTFKNCVAKYDEL